MTVGPETDAFVDGRPESSRRSLARVGLLSGAWLSLARWMVRAAHIVTVVLMARLLSPGEYGLFALVKTFSNLILVGSFGLQAAIIQKKGEVTRHELDVAWTHDKLLLNIGLAVVITSGAGQVATFFGERGLVDLTRALALVPLAQGLENNAATVFTRQLEYRRRFWLEAANGLTTLLLVVPLALAWRSAWAFVVALVGGLLVRALLSYAMYPVFPRVRLDAVVFRELFAFGKWMLPLKLVTSLRDQGPALAVGRLLGAMPLGLFHLATRFGAQLGGDLDQTARKVLFPMYATIQSNDARMARGFRKALEATWLVVLPFAAVMAVLAQPATVAVFGPVWEPAVPFVRLMCAVSVFRISTNAVLPLLRGRGNAASALRLQTIAAVAVCGSVSAGALVGGLSGAVVGLLLGEAAMTPVWLVIVRRLGVPTAALGAALFVPGIVAATSAFLAGSAASLAGTAGPWLQLFAGLLGAGTGFLAALLGAARMLDHELLRGVLRRAGARFARRGNVEPEGRPS